jgi:hypothetical protein
VAENPARLRVNPVTVFFPHVLLSLLMVSPTVARELEATKLRPTAVFQGSHSQIKKETFRLIDTEAAWKELWKQHRGETTDRRHTEPDLALGIDFDTHCVVAVFTGNCDWCKVAPRQRGESVVIGFEACCYQIIGQPPVGTPVDPVEERARRKQGKQNKAAAPYAFVVLPRPIKTVVIEQDVRREIASPPEWKYRVTLHADDEKK